MFSKNKDLVDLIFVQSPKIYENVFHVLT